MEEVHSQGTPCAEETLALFKHHAETWRKDTCMVSDVGKILLHPSYQRIIGLGPAVIPAILADLQEHDYWGSALEALTGENPVPEGSRGNVAEAAKAWLRWGGDRGLIGEVK